MGYGLGKEMRAGVKDQDYDWVMVGVTVTGRCEKGERSYGPMRDQNQKANQKYKDQGFQGSEIRKKKDE